MGKPDLSEFDELADRRCKLAKALDGVSDDDKTRFEAAFENTRYDNTVFYDWFQHRGLDVSARAIQEHRAQKCRCHRA